MTTHEFALSDPAARLLGTDASLSTSLRDILTAALQDLIEAELTAPIGANPGERTTECVTQSNGHRPKFVSTPGGEVEIRTPKLRQYSFFPESLEPRRRIDKAHAHQRSSIEPLQRTVPPTDGSRTLRMWRPGSFRVAVQVGHHPDHYPAHPTRTQRVTLRGRHLRTRPNPRFQSRRSCRPKRGARWPRTQRSQLPCCDLQQPARR